MQAYEESNCSFVVKIWVEPKDDPAAIPVWRGHITHVISGERRYFTDLTLVIAFIQRYLAQMGITDHEDHQTGSSTT